MIANVTGGVLILLGMVISFGNIYIPIKNKFLDNKKSYSMVPVIGGAFVFIGLFVFNDFTFSLYYSIFLFIDPGCVLLILAMMIYVFRKH